jgi:hypothetical protein
LFLDRKPELLLCLIPSRQRSKGARGAQLHALFAFKRVKQKRKKTSSAKPEGKQRRSARVEFTLEAAATLSAIFETNTAGVGR